MKKEINEHIITTPLEEIMGDRFGRYSKYIIQDRALPDARDGLKPVQRRILYAMNKDGNTHLNKYRKSAKSVGLIMGNYHPHGDSSIYDAMVRLSQDWKSRLPLIDMQGNNGSIDDDPAAAMRYTEARLSSIAQLLLEDIDKDTVNFAPNFDDTELEPTVLPAKYPNLLINGISGIAAGYATNIPPHNLNEVIDATIHRLKYPNCGLDALMKYIQGPDFPTGGIVQGKQGIIDAFNTGKGKIVVRGKVEKTKTRTGQQLIITEIPYEVVKCNLVKKIDDIRLNHDVDGISDVRDESDRLGLKIVIDLKKDVNADLILNYLYKNTDLQVSYNYNVVAIVDKQPKQLSLMAILDSFISHRKEVVIRRSRYDLAKKEERCHILEGLTKCLSILDEVIELIRNSKDKKDAKRGLTNQFGFSEAQSEAIVNLRLYRLTNTDVVSLQDEYKQLLQEMEILRNILDDEKVLINVLIDELKAVKKTYPTKRLSVIEDEISEINISKEQMIADEQVMVTISRDGYIKRVSLRSYGASNNQTTKVKDNDELIGYKEVSTLDNLLFTTNQGTYGYLPVYEIDEAKWKDLGVHLNAKLRIDSEEKIIDAITINDFSANVYLVTVSKHGNIKRTPLSDLKVSRNNKTYMLMKLHSEDEAVASKIVYENESIVLCTRNGYALKYQVSDIPVSSPKSKGVKAMNLNGDVIVGLGVIQNENQNLVVYNEEGYNKRLKLDDIASLTRPAKGQLIHKSLKTNPNYIQLIRVANLNDELVYLGNNNMNILVKELSLLGKDATFSKMFDLGGEDYLMKGIQCLDQSHKKSNDLKSEEKQITLDI